MFIPYWNAETFAGGSFQDDHFALCGKIQPKVVTWKIELISGSSCLPSSQQQKQPTTLIGCRLAIITLCQIDSYGPKTQRYRSYVCGALMRSGQDSSGLHWQL